MTLYWVGPRESDLSGAESMFQGSITLYGSGTGSNQAFCSNEGIRINHNADHPDADAFVLNCQNEIVQENQDCRFMSYNPNCLVGAPKAMQDRAICFNSEHILSMLNNKLSFREFARDIVPILPYHRILGCECTMQALHSLGGEKFIVQEAFSSGGEGTYILTEDTEAEVCRRIEPEQEYLVSAYYSKNVPLNLHAVIFDEQIVLFPGSIQVVVREGNRLLYRGADYIAYQQLPEHVRKLFMESAYQLCEKIQKVGYRGVLGVDAMWVGAEQVYILEVNDRFQGSTHLLNRALRENGLEPLQKYHLDAFMKQNVEEVVLQRISELKVPYSSFSQINCDGGRHGRHVFSRFVNDQYMVELLRDGYDPSQLAEENALLFTQVFRTNIVSLCSGECCVRLHPSLCAHSDVWYRDICDGDLQRLKIALINQGALITEEAKEFIRTNGEMREGTYVSLDLFIRGVYINCPIYVKFACYSPFAVDVNELGSSLCLKYYGNALADVSYDKKFRIPQKALDTGVPLDKICFLATDRLRLQNNSYCTFPKNEKGCRFCEVTAADQCFTEQDVLNAIRLYYSFEPRPFRHVLIGGASKEIGKEFHTILKMCAVIREYSDMPIYLMCLPPSKKEIVDRYFEAGITEFSFNMEIFDPVLAKRYMPGKGCIPRKNYLRALSWAAEAAGRQGQVRCSFVAGLEPMESILQGIEAVCNVGAAPILSVFRPIPFTEMAEMIPPSNDWLMELTEKATQICHRYGLELGPECPACRNNTLSIVSENEAVDYHKEHY